MSGPPTPTGGLGPGSLGSGGPNTPLVVPQPVKPPSSRSGGVKTYQCKICDQVRESFPKIYIYVHVFAINYFLKKKKKTNFGRRGSGGGGRLKPRFISIFKLLLKLCISPIVCL